MRVRGWGGMTLKAINKLDLVYIGQGWLTRIGVFSQADRQTFRFLYKKLNIKISAGQLAETNFVVRESCP